MPPSATRVKASGSEAAMVAAMKEDTAAMESFIMNFFFFFFWKEDLEFLSEMLQVELAEMVLLVRYVLLFIPRSNQCGLPGYSINQPSDGACLTFDIIRGPSIIFLSNHPNKTFQMQKWSNLAGMSTSPPLSKSIYR